MSDDGNRIVGFARTDIASQEAFLWEPTTGMRRLADALADDYGLFLTPTEFLVDAGAISGDGHRILGMGTDPDGNGGQVFLVTLGTP